MPGRDIAAPAPPKRPPRNRNHAANASAPPEIVPSGPTHKASCWARSCVVPSSFRSVNCQATSVGSGPFLRRNLSASQFTLTVQNAQSPSKIRSGGLGGLGTGPPCHRLHIQSLRARTDRRGGYRGRPGAGPGSLKGLCPFHDEKTPSFQVTPSRGLWYCFGACAEGGDVINFLQKIDNLSFTEAVERLADRVGLQLRHTEDHGHRAEPGQRVRLMEALQAAAEFFIEQLGSSDAIVGRRFLAERGFDRAAAERFGVGFAPREGRALLQHLRGRGFSNKELIAAGLARESGYDFFQSRLLWPIRDSGKQVLGFGARRLFDDDRMPAKYVNTPETLLYKKSHVLYGLDLARTAIGKKSQAVVVEGYTDVMAAHLAGVDTAVASCGTAFGDDHARLLRRLMGNHDAFHGEVIFTFDGDEAGQAAALKVFSGDQNFIAQTYVAVEPTGLDPCDLRLQHGDADVRELVG